MQIVCILMSNLFPKITSNKKENLKIFKNFVKLQVHPLRPRNQTPRATAPNYYDTFHYRRWQK